MLAFGAKSAKKYLKHLFDFRVNISSKSHQEML